MTESTTHPNNDVVIDIHDNNNNNNNSTESYFKKKCFRKRLFEIIEVADNGDIVSAIYDIFMITVIIASLVPLAFKEEYEIFNIMDIIVVTIFIIDYILRLITADYKFHKKSFLAFLLYPIYPWAIIDLLSILPSLTIIYENLKLLRIINLIKTLKIIRAFKTLRYNKNIYIILRVIKKSKKPLSTVCSLAFGYILISALLVFNVEKDENFQSFFNAVYWATVSLTTVGYGDIYPTSTLGRVIAMFSSVFGVALVALPSGIITAGYMDSLNSILEKKMSSMSLVKEEENNNNNTNDNTNNNNTNNNTNDNTTNSDNI